MRRLRRMLAGGEGLRIGRFSLALSRYGLFLVLRSGPRPVGLVIKPARHIRMDESEARYRHCGRIGPLYWRTFERCE